MIESFSGEYRWLSNFWPVEIEWLGLKWPSLEHSYVATKCDSFADVLFILFDEKGKKREMTAGQVKRYGKKIKIRGDWEGMRVDTMRSLLKLKFQDPELRQKLIATGDEQIIEGNRWHDTFWGTCKCDKCEPGENILGKLLMKLREQIDRNDAKAQVITKRPTARFYR